ncbi:MAG TPA: protein kinase [Pyrinomonadaceae bacterium]|nr:protein kinase [Pyrinomonadaceae bacterium]
MSVAAGTEIGRYKILSKLGQGGMGEVYLAEDTRMRRNVALKILPADVAADRVRMERFVQEAKAASALNHPNIITIYEIDRTKSGHFIAIEYIDGQTLRERAATSSMTVGDVLDIAIQATSALAEAHEAGIVHRDIKPDNIMIRRDGIVKVLDFGLAKLSEPPSPVFVDSEAPTSINIRTEPGVVMGTAVYMSPEQARGLPVDVRTDIFSLGIVLYEIIAGRLPFKGSDRVEVLMAILGDAQPPPLARYAPEAPDELQRIVAKALAKPREDRYQSTNDLLNDLRNLKKRLEIDAEIQRTLPPEGVPPARRTAELSAALKTETPGAVTSTIPAAASVSSPSPRAGSKLQKRTVVITAALAALAVTLGLLWYFKSGSGAPLNEEDTIVVADFINTTGDPVFDGTLKQALASQLEQSPFLSIFSDIRVREALRLMNRSPDERVTKEIARQICLRQGFKAFLNGSISNIGSHYVVTLEATNAQTGDTIALEQAEADSKEQVLAALGTAATNLRKQLGESLASIQKYDKPIHQATTSSLEALKYYSNGIEQQLKGRYLDAIPSFKKATEIDQNFARAYAAMSSMYYNTRQYELAAEASRKAYELRDRVGENERLYITQAYYDNVTGELEKYLQTLEQWKITYPRDASPSNNLAVKYNELGLFDKAAAEAREAIRLNPGSTSGYSLLAAAQLALNRFDDAKQTINQAQGQKLDSTAMRRTLFRIAFVQHDTATMQQQIDWLSGKPDDYLAQGWQSETAAFLGQLKKSQELSDNALESAERRDQKDVAAQIAVAGAARDALFGDCARLKDQTAKALGLTNRQVTTANAANALSSCPEASGFIQAQTLIAELTRRSPTDTVLNKILAPLVQARMELHRDNAAQAIQLLETTRPFEGYALFQIAYLRGQAYLKQQKGAEAATEFQKILDHRGSQPTSPIYVVAHLGLARAAVVQSDTVKARKAYQDFFALWKDADANVPVLIEARKEYDKLN